MKWDGIIEQFMNSWNAPLLLIKKIDTSEKDKFKIVVDFRSLNEVTLNSPPTHYLTENLDKLRQSII